MIDQGVPEPPGIDTKIHSGDKGNGLPFNMVFRSILCFQRPFLGYPSPETGIGFGGWRAQAIPLQYRKSKPNWLFANQSRDFAGTQQGPMQTACSHQGSKRIEKVNGYAASVRTAGARNRSCQKHYIPGRRGNKRAVWIRVFAKDTDRIQNVS